MSVSGWGLATYGDPCRECGYDWSVPQQDAIQLVMDMPRVLRELVADKDVARRHPDLSWSVLEYVCHVGDNLRISAERLIGVAAGGLER